MTGLLLCFDGLRSATGALSAESSPHLPTSSQPPAVGMLVPRKQQPKAGAALIPTSLSMNSFQGRFGVAGVCKDPPQRWGRPWAEAFLALPSVMKHCFGSGFFLPSAASLKEASPCWVGGGTVCNGASASLLHLIWRHKTPATHYAESLDPSQLDPGPGISFNVWFSKHQVPL